jgi:DNA-directed RNA polymerase subunit RPC12/RpoP
MVCAVAMSEFKFACPVCGQHITADSSSTGGQLECPTCFQKIIVPQAPATQDSKFILSAAQVAKPRPTSPDAASQFSSLQRSPQRSSIAALVALLVLVGAAGAALYVFRDRFFRSGRTPPAASTHAQPSASPSGLNPASPVPTNLLWTLDLTNAAFPEAPVVGRIHGSGFRSERAILRGNVLSLSQGKAWPWDLAVNITFNVRQGEELSGKTVEIPPERPRALHTVLRWKNEQQQPATEGFHRGYALKVTFGEAANGHIPGKIYLCLPDGDKSFVAGTFNAQIRRPPPPKGAPHPPPGPKPGPAP